MYESQDEWVQKALAHGFTNAVALDATTLISLDAVRDMCAAGKCGKYDGCWTCPPACGSIDENKKALKRYSKGILVQVTMALSDDFDYDTMTLCGQRHKALFASFYRLLRAKGLVDILALGAGGCDLCGECAYPDAPCRQPDNALSSMEAYGLLVSDVCKQNGLPYYYGPRTMTFTGCFLFANEPHVNICD